jgi:hypothetical protein
MSTRVTSGIGTKRTRQHISLRSVIEGKTDSALNSKTARESSNLRFLRRETLVRNPMGKFVSGPALLDPALVEQVLYDFCTWRKKNCAYPAATAKVLHQLTLAVCRKGSSSLYPCSPGAIGSPRRCRSLQPRNPYQLTVNNSACTSRSCRLTCRGCIQQDDRPRSTHVSRDR